MVEMIRHNPTRENAESLCISSGTRLGNCKWLRTCGILQTDVRAASKPPVFINVFWLFVTN